MTVSYVYFMLGASTGRLKIGKSDNPNDRRRTLEHGGGQAIDILAVIECSDSDAASVLERRLHEHYRQDRTEWGEWFELTPALYRAVMRLRDGRDHRVVFKDALAEPRVHPRCTPVRAFWHPTQAEVDREHERIAAARALRRARRSAA